jgi:integrase
MLCSHPLDGFDLIVAASFRLRLLTAQRDGEVRHMRWSKIDGDWWTIPGGKTKNDRQHRVYLSELTREVLSALKPLCRGDWLLPSPRIDGKPVGTLAKANGRLRKAAKLDDFKPHDLRRTAATIMAEIRVEPQGQINH